MNESRWKSRKLIVTIAGIIGVLVLGLTRAIDGGTALDTIKGFVMVYVGAQAVTDFSKHWKKT